MKLGRTRLVKLAFDRLADRLTGGGVRQFPRQKVYERGQALASRPSKPGLARPSSFDSGVSPGLWNAFLTFDLLLVACGARPGPVPNGGVFELGLEGERQLRLGGLRLSDRNLRRTEGSAQDLCGASPNRHSIQSGR